MKLSPPNLTYISDSTPAVPGHGHLPTPRPQKHHKSERHRDRERPPQAVAQHTPPASRSQEEAGGASSMPEFGFGDLGDDLQLSDDSE